MLMCCMPGGRACRKADSVWSLIQSRTSFSGGNTLKSTDGPCFVYKALTGSWVLEMRMVCRVPLSSFRRLVWSQGWLLIFKILTFSWQRGNFDNLTNPSPPLCLGPSKMTYVYNGIRVKWSRIKWYTQNRSFWRFWLEMYRMVEKLNLNLIYTTSKPSASPLNHLDHL